MDQRVSTLQRIPGSCGASVSKGWNYDICNGSYKKLLAKLTGMGAVASGCET